MGLKQTIAGSGRLKYLGRHLSGTAFYPHRHALDSEDHSHANMTFLIQMNELTVYPGFGELLESHSVNLSGLWQLTAEAPPSPCVQM